jgi:hypothetical protein
MAAASSPHTALVLVRRRGGRAPGGVELDVLAREAGLSPELVLRLVRLGLVAPSGGTAQAPLFAPDAAARLARAARLRRDLGIDYAGAVLASELLERIEALEQMLARRRRIPAPVVVATDPLGARSARPTATRSGPERSRRLS